MVFDFESGPREALLEMQSQSEYIYVSRRGLSRVVRHLESFPDGEFFLLCPVDCGDHFKLSPILFES